MGTLKLRDLKQIHTGNINELTYENSTTATYAQFKPYEYKGLISQSKYDSFGCCTSTASKQCNDSKRYENMFVGLEISRFPSSYRNMELVNEWLDFLHNLLPIFDIKVVCDFEQKLVNPEYWKEKELRFTFQKDKIYFVIKKDHKNYPEQTYNCGALFQLSMLRYLVSNEYYFMIYDCLRLRKLKSLSKLSNLDIVNIARFGVQTNSSQFKTKNSSSYDFAFLRAYRSPFYNSFAPTVLNSADIIVKSLDVDLTSQNMACGNNTYININVIYLMLLFQQRQYLKLFKLITDSKYHTRKFSNITENILGPIFNNRKRFDDMNNIKLDKKEYEKTL